MADGDHSMIDSNSGDLPSGAMFDTNIFDRILDNDITHESLPPNIPLFVTHVQRDEINKCSDPERRKQLKVVFNEIAQDNVATESFILDVSMIGRAKLGDGRLIEKIREGNIKHSEDALIGETCIKNSYLLVTEDQRLLKKVRELGGKAVTFQEFMAL